ncbi:iron-sulfur cluster assembly scaffold protein [Pelosinus baikalensis]|uniref:Iron-sulfur cluster assembly scaffold protein n=1 Tax=Pelosinus baikalensis TaxID=2892015 RepID=A0ABS8HVY7_9FIRM|nr:iron-sulfur cluster assembly scaffold protein [Pelosinus baikalensis]MCC5466307.1 iron-sulfur cluster assembly scaffold protein [Pelosinus baikalensis]
MYSDTVIDHFMSPRNAWQMPDADGIGTIGEPDCGDHCMMFIKIREEIIHEISFLIFGCGAAVASGSMTTVLAKGKSIKEALELTEQDIINALDGLPEGKQHCSNLGVAALQAAIKDYLAKQGES